MSAAKSIVPFSDEQLQALDAAFGDVRIVAGKIPDTKPWAAKPAKDAPSGVALPPWQAVFRKPTLGEGEAFEGAANHEGTRAAAMRNLAKATVVGVSFGGEQTIAAEAGKSGQKDVRDAWDRIRKDYPLAHIAAKDELQSLLGQEQEQAEKD